MEVMTPQQINVKLQSMKGKTFKYGEQVMEVKTFIINREDECFTMSAGRTRFNRTFRQAPDFFKSWYEVKEPGQAKEDETAAEEQLPVTTNGKEVAQVEKTSAGFAESLINIMMKNIEKVQTSPAYLKQAESVTKSVSTIINVKRLEISMVKEMNKANSGSGSDRTGVRRKKS